MMKLILRSRVSFVALILLASFFPFLWVFDATELYLLTGSILLTTSITAVAAYWTVIKSTFMSSVGCLDRTEVLAFGIILLFAGTAFREGYVTFWRQFFPLSDVRPDEFLYPLCFIRYACIVASIMSLSARKAILGPAYMSRVPGWPHALLSLLAGIFLGFGMIVWGT